MTRLTFLHQLVTGLAKLPPGPARTIATFVMVNIAILIDRSGSMGSRCGAVNRLDAARHATLSLIDARLNAGANDRLSIISFDHMAQIVLPFTPCRENRDRIKIAMQSIDIGGGTELKAPLQLVNKIYPCEGPLHIILLSDGHGGSPITTARKLKDRGAILETIGVGNDPSDVDEDVMKKIASEVDGKILYRFLTDANEINNHFKTEIANRLAKRG